MENIPRLPAPNDASINHALCYKYKVTIARAGHTVRETIFPGLTGQRAKKSEASISWKKVAYADFIPLPIEQNDKV